MVMAPKDYSGDIVWFKTNVILVQIEDKSLVINLARRQKFKENNPAAHMLLYLMMRDRGEEIDFNGLKTHILNQYELTDAQATTELNAFLNKLSGYKLIGSDRGTGTDDTDPLNLYPPISPRLTWETPDLIEGSRPDNRASIIYSGGYIRITYRP